MNGDFSKGRQDKSNENSQERIAGKTHTSLPQTPTNLMRTIASVGSVMVGSGRSSIFALPGPYRNTEGFMFVDDDILGKS